MIVLMKYKKLLEDGGEDVNSHRQDTLMYYTNIDQKGANNELYFSCAYFPVQTRFRRS